MPPDTRIQVTSGPGSSSLVPNSVFGKISGYVVSTWKIFVEIKCVDLGAIVLSFRTILCLYIMLSGD